MAIQSGVEWCDSAVNPVAGCDGCELWVPDKDIRRCYAGVMTERYKGLPGWPATFLDPKEFPGRMAQAAKWSDLRGTVRPDKPWLDGMPRVIFISDMGDALSKSISFPYLYAEIYRACTGLPGRRHLYLWLTKQPHRAAEFDRWLESAGRSWPKNLAIGTSITEARFLPRIRHLLECTRAPLRFLSVEPVVEPVDLNSSSAGNVLSPCHDCGDEARPACRACCGLGRIGWVATGGESGTGARPCNLADLRSVKVQCEDAAVPVFVKQVGAFPSLVGYVPGWSRKLALPFVKIKDPKGGDMSEWPEDLRVRQMPAWSYSEKGGATWA